MNDIERWVNLEGEPPAGIRELLEAGREVPDLTPEESASMESSFLEALAARRRKRARARKAKWAIGATALVAAAAGIAMLVRGSAPIKGAPGEEARVGMPSATAPTPVVTVPTTTAPAVPATGSTEVHAAPTASAGPAAPGSSAPRPSAPPQRRSMDNAKGSR
ncbi:MAG: hypothetical protein U0359_20695 [Byssovorax sp.]